MSLWLPEIPANSPKRLIDYREKLVKKRQVPRVNLPALARRDAGFMQTWQADAGHVFVSSDFTSLEPSITASFAQDEYYRYATFDGIGQKPWFDEQGVLMIDDIYLMVASVIPNSKQAIREFFLDPQNVEMWVKDSERVKDHPVIKPLRKRAKPAALGFNYGMRPKKFVSMSYDSGIVISLSDAQKMYDAYWQLFSGVKTLTQVLEKMINKDGALTNPFGYRLTTQPHKGYNAFIQSTASGVLDVLCLKFFAALPEAQFVAMVHDEVIYQIPEASIEKAKKIQDECVASLNKDLKFHVPMRLGFVTAKNFAEIK